MEKQPEVLGLIAGNRNLPLELARHARAMGVRRLVAVAFVNETDPSLADLVDEIAWIRVGQLGKMISTLKRHGVTQCVMAGQVAPRNLFDLRPDLRAAAMLMRLKEKNAHSIFGAIAKEMEKDGVQLIDALPWLRPLMPQEGFQLGPAPSREQVNDIDFGYQMAKEITRLEIGQIVVVKNGAVLAVEGFEGTDRCLARGGELAGKSGGAVAVKVARRNHDMRFDIPCMGMKTVETCGESGVSVLAVEAGSTLLLDREKVADYVRKHRISLVGIPQTDPKQK